MGPHWLQLYEAIRLRYPMGQAEEYAEEKPSITFENIQWSAILNYYFSKGSFTISELVKVSEFSRPTVTSTVHEALELGYLEELSGTADRRRRDFRPTEPMLEAWRNYCNALLANPEFSRTLKLAQTLISMRELEAQSSDASM